jgi:hypothetical protein
LNTPGGFEGILLLAPGVIGTRGGGISVAGMSPVAVLFPLANAKQRGRVFLPGISDGDCVDGVITAAYKALFTTHAVCLTQLLTLAGGGGPTATPVVYSRKPLPATSRIVEYARLSALVGTMKRRQRPV